MSWAQVHTEVFTHQKTGKFARLLRCTQHDLNRFAAGGIVASVWCWASTNAKDGDLSNIHWDDIAFGIGYPGTGEELCQFLTESGWLDANGTLHDWMEHTGKSLLARDEKLQKMRAGKDRKRLQKPLQDDLQGSLVDDLQEGSSRSSTRATLRYALPCSALPCSESYEGGGSVDVKGSDNSNGNHVKTPPPPSKNGKSSHVKFDHVLSQEEYEKIRSETIPVYVEMLRDYQSGNWPDDLDLTEEWKRRRNKRLNSLGCPTARFVEAIRKYDDKEEWQYMAFDEAAVSSKAVVRS